MVLLITFDSGYTTPETVSISHPSDSLKFKDEIESLNETIKIIKARHPDIDKFIGLSHSGIDHDQKTCEEVPEMDLIVGGHSHTFLYTVNLRLYYHSVSITKIFQGTPVEPHPEIEGPYPIVIQKSTAKKCLVVQASAFGKYLGFLQVSFDEHGDISSWSGQPILIDTKFQPDHQTEMALVGFKANLSRFEQETVAKTSVKMKASNGVCRIKECLIGNVVADAFVEHGRLEIAKMLGE